MTATWVALITHSRIISNQWYVPCSLYLTYLVHDNMGWKVGDMEMNNKTYQTAHPYKHHLHWSPQKKVERTMQTHSTTELAPRPCPITGRQQADSAAATIPNFPLYQAVFTPNATKDAQVINPHHTANMSTPTQQANQLRSYLPVQLPTSLHLQQTMVSPMSTPTMAETLPLFHGNYSNKEEPAHLS